MSDEHGYLDLLRKVRADGHTKHDRTGTGTLSLFDEGLRFDLLDGFPLVTTKSVSLWNIKTELEWMLQGDTNIRYLLDRGVRIWSDWPLERYNRYQAIRGHDPITKKEFEKLICSNFDFSMMWGNIGPGYGKQWRNFEGVDQLAKSIETLETNPDSRRNIVNFWHPEEVEYTSLPPCHMMHQFYTYEASEAEKRIYWINNFGYEEGDYPVPDRVLCTKMYQRSADLFLGVPYNIAFYALLTHVMASRVNMIPGYLGITFGDAHIYSNHMEAVNTQLSRVPISAPQLRLRGPHDPLQRNFEIDYEWLEHYPYVPHPAIRAPIAV